MTRPLPPSPASSGSSPEASRAAAWWSTTARAVTRCLLESAASGHQLSLFSDISGGFLNSVAEVRPGFVAHLLAATFFVRDHRYYSYSYDAAFSCAYHAWSAFYAEI